MRLSNLANECDPVQQSRELAHSQSRKPIPIPSNGPLETLSEQGSGSKGELPLGPAGVQTPPRLAIGLGQVPDEVALKASELGHHVRELPDGDLLPRTQVHWIRLLVTLGGKADPLCAVLNVEELSRGPTRTP